VNTGDCIILYSRSNLLSWASASSGFSGWCGWWSCSVEAKEYVLYSGRSLNLSRYCRTSRWNYRVDQKN